MELDGKVAIITGAANGMGEATARRLAELGAIVVGVDVADDAGARVFAELGAPHEYKHLDVGNEQGWNAVVEETVREKGALDVLDLNAGVTTRPPQSLTVEAYRRVSRVNVDGVVLGVCAALPYLEQGGGGAIVIVASLAGIRPMPDPLYGLTKHAVVGFGRTLGPKVKPNGVSVDVICPASVRTALSPSHLWDDPDRNYSPPSYIADAVVHVIRNEGAGDVWVPLQEPEPPFRVRFPTIVEGETGKWRRAPDHADA